MHVTHAFQPVYDRHSTILILGTMPSPQSIRHGFYYSHPQNRFWPLMAYLYHDDTPDSPEAKRAFAIRHGIALWDVLGSCDINGASDASIRHPVPNDFSQLLQEAPIARIFTTGKTAYTLFQRHIAPTLHRDAIYLPSTSPANQALFPWNKLVQAWQTALLDCNINN